MHVRHITSVQLEHLTVTILHLCVINNLLTNNSLTGSKSSPSHNRRMLRRDRHSDAGAHTTKQEHTSLGEMDKPEDHPVNEKPEPSQEVLSRPGCIGSLSPDDITAAQYDLTESVATKDVKLAATAKDSAMQTPHDGKSAAYVRNRRHSDASQRYKNKTTGSKRGLCT